MALLEVAVDETVVTVILTSGNGNTISLDLLEELVLFLEKVAGDPSIKAIILTGSGKFFSAGFDLVELCNYSRSQFEIFFRKFLSVCENLFCIGKPTVASINGHAIAGGYILASTCDFRIMGEGNFKAGVNEIKVGVPFPLLPILSRFLAGRHLREILLQGRLYSPEEALELGLVDRIAPVNKLKEETFSLIHELCSVSLKSYECNKKYNNREFLLTLREMNEVVIEDFIECWFSKDTRSRIAIILDRLKK